MRPTAPKLLAATALGTVALVPAALPAGAGGVTARTAALPCQVPETDRHHVFRVNLDGDRARERIDVFNFDAAVTPATGVMVCDSAHGRWARVQLTYVFTSPGARTSGLVHAWAGDLNRDGRVEVAARNFITPSAGESLVVLRQRARHSRIFRRLQVIAADQVVLHPQPHSAATVTGVIKANHARDNRRHVERLAWSARSDQWRCIRDCGGR